MILNVYFRNEWRYAEDWHDMGELAMSVVRSIKPRSEIATFGFSEERHTGVSGPDNVLRLALNCDTGFGGFVWLVEEDLPRRGGVYDSVWVSDNLEPPVVEPWVASDPWAPVYLAKRSVLPIPEIIATLQEYCRVGTGDRPECIEWARGNMNGTLLEG